MSFSADMLPETELGDIWLAATDAGLVALNLWGEETPFVAQVAQLTGKTAVAASSTRQQILDQAKSELHDYLTKERRTFTVPLNWAVMSPFQKKAMQAVFAIPYGQTRTYKEIAASIGKPKAVRALGRANATNPMPIIVPCHRVLGSDGKLQGYSAPGGLETKAWLLRLEGSWLI